MNTPVDSIPFASQHANQQIHRSLRTFAAVFFCVCIAGLIMGIPHAAAATTRGSVHILPLRYMDAIVIESNGHFGIIDGGEDYDYPDGSDPRYPVRTGIDHWHGADRQVFNTLSSLGVTAQNLDFYLGTHAHSDHIGLADDIIYAYHPKRVYAPLYSDTYISNPARLWDNQYVYDHMIQAAHDTGAQLIQTPRAAERTFKLGSLTLTIENYREITPDFRTNDANDYSWGVLVSDGISKMFLAGDINNFTGSEDRLTQTIGKVDALKLGHHGFPESNTESYLRALHPTYAVLTGDKSSLYAPSAQALFDIHTNVFTPADAQSHNVSTISFTFTSKGLAPNIKRSPTEIVYHIQPNSPHMIATYPDFRMAKVPAGWVSFGNNWYYFEKNSSHAIENTWKRINGAWYHFKDNAAMSTWWFKDAQNNWYYLGASGAMATGWQSINGSWYYLSKSGVMKTGWQWIGGAWYYLKPSGEMQTGWLKTTNGSWYYLDASGQMKTGWQWIKGAWYYFSNSGIMKTGWHKSGSTWYLLKPSGAMATGWAQTSDGTWYYFASSGAMKTGWQWIGGAWYYLNSSGAMATGWVHLGNSWYYLKSSGALATGWFKTADGHWYYANHSGVMQKSQWVGNYYLGSSGAMLTDAWIGTYYVGHDGAWVKGATPSPQNTKSTQSTQSAPGILSTRSTT